MEKYLPLVLLVCCLLTAAACSTAARQGTGRGAPIPGAPEYLRRVTAANGRILYVTGRHAGMADGTLESFRAARFPLPDHVRTIVDRLRPA